tara:strand:+ start:88 stop:753 length:666 start_codon:yes stop_codon:yes gene_type:complete
MKKTLITLLVIPFLTVFAKAADLSDAGLVIGVGGSQYVAGATVTETQDGGFPSSDPVKSTDKESGVFADTTGYVFAEVAIDRLAVGLSYNAGSLATPNATNNKNGSTNTVQVDIADIVTAYVTLDVVGGFYAKLGLVDGTIETNESINTSSGASGSIGDQSLEGTVAGLGYKHTLDTGVQIRSEALYGSYDDFSVTDANGDKYDANSMQSLQVNLGLAYVF